MTPIDANALRTSTEREVQVALQALSTALSPAVALITASTETEIQNAIYRLRSRAPNHVAINALAATAASLRLIADAKRQGRCNFHNSQVLRLRKQIFA